MKECRSIQHSSFFQNLSFLPKSCALYLQVPKSPDSQICARAFRQKGERSYSKLQRNFNTLEMLPSSSTSHRCRMELGVSELHTVYSSKAWKTSERCHTTPCHHFCWDAHRAAVYKFSQVTMRGMLRMEMLGTWVQAELWAMLGLQRSNKLP